MCAGSALRTQTAILGLTYSSFCKLAEKKTGVVSYETAPVFTFRERPGGRTTPEERETSNRGQGALRFFCAWDFCTKRKRNLTKQCEKRVKVIPKMVYTHFKFQKSSEELNKL